MKNLIILICCVVLASFATAQEQTSYTKTINPKSSDVILFNADIPVGVKEWKEDKLRILVDVVHNDGIGTEVLESLMQIGRYDVKSEKNGKELVVSMPGLRNEILMGGEVIQEAISLLVFAPKGVTVETELEDSRGVRITKKGGFTEALEMEFEFNIPFMVSFAGETTAAEVTPDRGVAGELEDKLKQKNADLQAFVKDLAKMQKELDASYKDVMTPTDHENVNNLLMGIEQKNQELQALFNAVNLIQSQLEDTYGQ